MHVPSVNACSLVPLFRCILLLLAWTKQRHYNIERVAPPSQPLNYVCTFFFADVNHMMCVCILGPFPQERLVKDWKEGHQRKLARHQEYTSVSAQEG